MAEERIDIPEISEIIKLEGGDVRRYSTGNVAAPNSSVKILSRYLRTSTGSCHDLCKYGMRHAGETRARSSILKKATIRSENSGLEMIQETATSAGRNKKLAIGLKPSLNSITQKLDNPVVIRREVSPVTKKVTVSSDKVSSPLKEIDVSVKRAGDPKLKPVKSKLPSQLTPGYLNKTRNSEIKKIKEIGALSMNSAGVSDSRKKSEIGKRKELRTSERGEKKVLVPPSVASSAKHSVKRVSLMNAENSKNLTGSSVSKNQSNARKTNSEQPSSEDVPPSVASSAKHSVKRVSSMNAKSSKNLTGISVLKNQSNARETKPEQPSSEDVPEKILYIVEMSTENKTVRPIQDGSHSSDLSPSSYSSSEDKRLKHTQRGTRTGRSPPSVEKKNLRRSQNGISATRLLPSLSSSSKSKGLRHSQYGTYIAQSSSFSLSKSAPSKASSEHDETETENQMMNLKEENKIRARKGGNFSSKDKDSLARKLKFRRGKVVELQSEVITPRRLKFRRRLLVDNTSGKVDAGRRSFGKKEGDDGEVGANRIQFNLSKKVVLRHQDVEGKKDAKSLLNNVIEETASKLVETRKSKVKALVGAFETVISLQDRKPLAKTSAY